MAPLVIAQRLPVLWLEAFGLAKAGAPRESERMVSEKIAATVEGSLAAGVEFNRLWWETSVAMMTGRHPPSAVSGGKRLAHAALAPAARTVRSNVRRLSRR